MYSSPVGDSSELKAVGFKLGDQEFGVDILKVNSIIRFESVTKVPGSPDFVDGIMNLRDTLIPIVDFGERLGVDKSRKAATSRVIILEISDWKVGLLVDSVTEVFTINQDRLEAPPTFFQGSSTRYLQSVAKLGKERLVLLVDVARLFSEAEEELIGQLVESPSGD